MAFQKRHSTKTVLSTVATIAASAMLIRTITNDFLPNEIQSYLYSGFHNFFNYFSSQFTIIIEEFRGFSKNQVFEAADIYLGTKVTSSASRVRLGKAENEKNLAITMDRDEEIVDDFDDIQVKWTLICTETESTVGHGSHLRDLNASLRSEARSYQLAFHKKHKEKVLNSYLPSVLERAKALKEEGKAVKLHTVSYNCNWGSNVMNLDHPMTFKNLALDSQLKKTILYDLDCFIKGKEFYKRIGKAWKRGYLLYGPPGTGKSSLVAAMANYLNYDIYDLDLTALQSNSDLKCLLLSMSSRSILVIEDIDCTIKLENRADEDDQSMPMPVPVEDPKKVTLSGLLNFIDGLWSCCGDERVFIFTTNHKDRLDPALLRPGRMDMHIHMSYCTFSAFKQLASNYLRLIDHKLFNEIEVLLGEAEATPAEVAGELMKNTDAEVSLQGLLEFLAKKKNEQVAMK